MNVRVVSRATAIASIGALVATASAAQAQEPAPLSVAGVPEDSVTPALYADQTGLFKRYGINVSIAPERSGSAISSGVAGGAFQIAKSSLTGLITAHGKGVPFVLVAAGGIYSASAPIVGLLVKSDSPIKSAADLNGKTIAVSALNDIYAVTTLEWMEKNGGKPETVKQLEFPVGAVSDALIAGRIDAGAVIEPVLSHAIEGGKVRVIGHPFDALAPRFLYTAWFAMADWAAQHPKEITAFARAMREASAYANGHKAQTVDLLAKYTSVEPAIIAKMQRVECGTSLDPKLIQPVIDASVKYKLVTAAFDARELIAPIMR
jgi:NitT/TauT family transport system substrate-binding protein